MSRLGNHPWNTMVHFPDLWLAMLTWAAVWLALDTIFGTESDLAISLFALASGWLLRSRLG